MSEPDPNKPDPQAIFDQFGEIFGDLFARSARPRRGRDLAQALRLTLHQAAHGDTRDVEIARGEGQEPTTLRVTIPPGVRPGQKLRLPGQGLTAPADAEDATGAPLPPGDLYLEIELALPKGLTIEGDDLVAHVRLDPAQALRGGVVTLPWIDGTARVAIPAGTEHDARVIQRGWGLLPLGTPFSPPPRLDSPYRSREASPRGDLVVVVSLARDADALLEAELAATPARPAGAPAELRAALVGLAIVATTIAYLLLQR